MSNDPFFKLRWHACHVSFDHRACKDAGTVSFPQAPHSLEGRKLVDGLGLLIPMQVELEHDDETPFQVSMIRAVVYQGRVEIGVAHDFNVYGSSRSTRREPLMLRLRGDVVRRIEHVRAGGPVSFELRFQCELSRQIYQKDTPHVLQACPQPYDFNFEVTYSRELWVRMLNETGFGENVAVEIPLPPCPAPEWQPIWKAIATARDGLKFSGETAWKAAIVECRHALEEWQKLEKEDHGPGWHAPNGQERSARTRQQRLDNLRWDLLQCAHEAAHTPADNWTRDDAVLILAGLAGLLARRNP